MAMPETTPNSALSGFSVLDFTQGVAGPHATQLMAQHGAEVTKIEPIEGDWCRTLGRQHGAFTAHYIAFNRGKASVALNLKDPEILDMVRERARTADVIAESFRPGVIERFGLDYEAVARDNPDVVYLSLSGFGQSGPYRDQPVTDAVIQAFSGWMSINRSREGIPQRVGMVAMDVMTGLYGFQSVMAALMRRERFGGGQWIDCSMMQSALAFQAAKIIEYHLQGGQLGNLYAPVGAFETADGIINITTMRDDHFRTLCTVLGRPALADDPRFATRHDRIAHEPALEALLRQAFRAKPAREWAERLTAAGVMNAVVLDYGEMLADPQVAAAQAFAALEQPGLGTVPVAGIPGAAPIVTPSPEVGAETRASLAAWGVPEAAIRQMAARGAVRLGDADAPVTTRGTGT